MATSAPADSKLAQKLPQRILQQETKRFADLSEIVK
jgi:hypothetical protein